MLYYLLAVIVLIFDQLTKWLIVKNMVIGQSTELIPNILYFTSSRNRGAAWSILEGQRFFFFIITAVVLVIVIYYMQKMGRFKPFLGTALGLVIGGTLGNFIDRLFRGEVVDFIHVYIFKYSYPIFNVADSSLVIGVILILIYMFIEEKKEKKHGNQ
ncbi:signal peptidase II [Scopulibacillus darangshiensis]|uniref:Lipoprotein signal peptidase n=1 Tax=Scopulibacillus darangshiensis TaxID=442528 RepID=A0A4R2P578_9BACL|nr:signal peptidase II [Scopulibacillus darangshiensis]